MKKGDKYRFSLQFGSDSEEEQQAGEFLEKLGNRKSAVIVEALHEYLKAHPELQNGCPKVEIRRTSLESRAAIEAMVQKLLEKKLAALNLETLSKGGEDRQDAGIETDMAQMLDNLDLFS